MTVPMQPGDTLPDPGTDAGWQALEDEAHARGYPNAQAYVDAYEHGRVNVGIAGYQPGNPHTGFGQIQAYERAAATSGESLHDFAAQHTPEALAAARGEVPARDGDGPGFDRHALRDEAHLHGFGSIDDYVRAWEHGEISSARDDGGYREITRLTDVATGHQESPSQYFHEHRHDHGGHHHPGQIDQHVDPSRVVVDNPYEHDWDWWKYTGQSHVPGDPDPGSDPSHFPGEGMVLNSEVAYPGHYVGPVTVGPDGTRNLPDGSHLTPEGLRIYPNGNIQDHDGRYLGDYHGEYHPSGELQVDPGGGLGPDHGMDGGDDTGGRLVHETVHPGGNGQPGQLVHETVHFGSGEPGASGGGFASGGGTVQGGEPPHGGDVQRGATDQTGDADRADDADHTHHEDTSHEQHSSESHPDSHSSSSHDEGSDHHESSHDSGGLEHHVG